MTAENEKVCYVPNKIRSRPLRCIILPIVGTFLFIMYWFVLCPLMYIGLCRMAPNWTHLWHFYFWITSFIIFLIIFVIIVLLWRTTCRSCSHSGEQEEQSMGTEMQTYPCAHETEHEDKLNKISTLGCKDNSNESYDVDVGKPEKEESKVQFEDKVERGSDYTLDDTKLLDQVGTKQNDVYICAEHRKVEAEHSISTSKKSAKPGKLTLQTDETDAQLHSPTYPLTPREIFFWDLIQSANKNDSVNFNLDNYGGLRESSLPTSPFYKEARLLSASDETQSLNNAKTHGGFKLDGNGDLDKNRCREGAEDHSKSQTDVMQNDETVGTKSTAANNNQMQQKRTDFEDIQQRGTLPVDIAKSSDREYFIANVSKRRSLSNEVYLYIDAGGDEKYLRIRSGEEPVII